MNQYKGYLQIQIDWQNLELNTHKSIKLTVEAFQSIRP